MKKRNRTMKFLAFAPAALAIGVTAMTAAGGSLVSGATAASTVTVGGNVASSLSADPTIDGGTGTTGCASETLGTFAATFASSDGCEISFSSNSVSGSEVVFENDTVGDARFFCADPPGAAVRDCTPDSGSLDDAPAGPAAIANGSDSFGIALMGLNSVTPADVPLRGSAMAAPNAAPGGTDPVWVGIPLEGAAGVQLCRMAGANTTSPSRCQFKFGGSGDAAQGAGTYTGTLRLTAQVT